ncbi:hypothetical protein [Thiocapsa rosea]|uniref:Uncharacterized protein n=1 Tax=Thiocapsa rosea TaxID=69360 RepID=A0A495VGC4_9GAMM|nr:hypothetical protein [Thiocapsa rosea]RKT47497.1 hypothetical protein BDD21_5089 [Thiocapsa rosea]
MTISTADLNEIIAQAQHEPAGAECAARLASGQSSADAAWIKETVADLRETLAEWRSLAKTTESVTELEDLAPIHAGTRRLIARSNADFVSATRQ